MLAAGLALLGHAPRTTALGTQRSNSRSLSDGEDEGSSLSGDEIDDDHLADVGDSEAIEEEEGMVTQLALFDGDWLQQQKRKWNLQVNHTPDAKHTEYLTDAGGDYSKPQL